MAEITLKSGKKIDIEENNIDTIRGIYDGCAIFTKDGNSYYTHTSFETLTQIFPNV